MNIAEKIKEYQNRLADNLEHSSVFLGMAEDIIRRFPFRLNKKTYLLVPDRTKELRDMAYEYSLSNGKTMPIIMSLEMSEMINKFNESAQKLGFTVITKMDEYLGDGDLFDLYGRQYGHEEVIGGYANLPEVKVPLTLSVDEFAQKPFFPVVFKNNTANRGEDKYLIETKEQLEKIMALFELPESKEINLKNEFVVQEYIKSFDNINSSIRVYTTCTGEILSSLFLVSADVTPQKRVKTYGIDVFNPCEYLTDSTSPYYLDSKNIISNAAGGGRVIPLNLENAQLKSEDALVLTLHEIDVETLALPEDITKQLKELCIYWGSKKGIVLGHDFIYNSNDNNWYFLETNQNPSIKGYMLFMNLKGFKRKDVQLLMQLDALTKIVENIMTEDMSTEKQIKK